MNLNRRAAIPAGAVVLFIILLLFAFMFGSLFYVRAGDSRALSVGEDKSTKPCIASVRKEIDALQQDINTLQRKNDVQTAVVQRLDADLLRYGSYHSGSAWILRGGSTVADPATSYKSAWAIIRDSIEGDRKIIQQRAQLHAELKAPERFSKIDDVTKKLREDGNKAYAEAAARDEQNTQIQKRLDQDQEKYLSETTKVKKEHDKELASRTNQIRQLEVRIRELLELKLNRFRDVQPFGHIMMTDPLRRFVIIDRGTKDGLTLGLKFQIFQYPKGAFTDKGMLEVCKLDDNSAVCRVLSETSEKNPVAREDFIGNPLFTPDRPRTFVLAGEFTSYRRPDIERFIANMGGIVRKDLQPGIDFLIIGTYAEDDATKKLIDDAREYQVVAMDEAQMIRYLSTTYKPATGAERAEIEAVRAQRKIATGAEKPAAAEGAEKKKPEAKE